jgi:hypothetical protein
MHRRSQSEFPLPLFEGRDGIHALDGLRILPNPGDVARIQVTDSRAWPAPWGPGQACWPWGIQAWHRWGARFLGVGGRCLGFTACARHWHTYRQSMCASVYRAKARACLYACARLRLVPYSQIPSSLDNLRENVACRNPRYPTRPWAWKWNLHASRIRKVRTRNTLGYAAEIMKKCGLLAQSGKKCRQQKHRR